MQKAKARFYRTLKSFYYASVYIEKQFISVCVQNVTYSILVNVLFYSTLSPPEKLIRQREDCPLIPLLGIQESMTHFFVNGLMRVDWYHGKQVNDTRQRQSLYPLRHVKPCSHDWMSKVDAITLFYKGMSSDHILKICAAGYAGH